jgi:hypothetical protein
MSKKEQDEKEAIAKAASDALITQTLEYIKQDIKEIKAKLDDKYVTKEEFLTVRGIVYGMVSLVLVSFVGALITLVFTRG